MEIMKNQTILKPPNRAEKEHHSHSRRFCQLLFTVSITIIHLGFCQKTQAQDFWEELYFPDSSKITSMVVNAEQELIVGSNNGVYISENGVTEWSSIGLAGKRVYSVAVNENGDIYAGLSQFPSSSNGLFRTSDLGETWESILSDVGLTGEVKSILTWEETIFISIWEAIGSALVRSTDNGNNWETVFSNENNSEYIAKIIRSSENEDIFICMDAFDEGMGGVYKSTDGGANWVILGMIANQVRSIALNSSNDLFAGSFGGLSDSTYSGLYVLRDGENQFEVCIDGPMVSDIALNGDDHIFFSSSLPHGVLRSIDNAESFELINEGLPIGPRGTLVSDDFGYLYVTSEVLSSSLHKSINPTVTVPENSTIKSHKSLEIFPNPANVFLNVKINTKNIFSTPSDIIIYNWVGDQVIKQKLNNIVNIHHIDTSGLVPGIYVVHVVNSDFSFKTKIIIQ